MRWNTVILTAGALVLSLSGCSDQASAIVSGDAEREQLVQRTIALQASVVAAGTISDAHRRELEDLTQDIVEWQGHTGRTDITVSSSRPAAGEDATSALISRNPPPTPCPSCPPVRVEGTQICFLAQGWCSPKDGLVKGCAYTCVSF